MIRTAVEVGAWNAEAIVGFTLLAQSYTSAVRLGVGSGSIDGKDDIEVLALKPDAGQEIILQVDGSDEKEAFSALLSSLLEVVAERTEDAALLEAGLIPADDEPSTYSDLSLQLKQLGDTLHTVGNHSSIGQRLRDRAAELQRQLAGLAADIVGRPEPAAAPPRKMPWSDEPSPTAEVVPPTACSKQVAAVPPAAPMPAARPAWDGTMPGVMAGKRPPTRVPGGGSNAGSKATPDSNSGSDGSKPG